MIVHGTGQLIQEPLFQNFLLGPLILFILDRLLTVSRKKIEIPVLRAELLPSSLFVPFYYITLGYIILLNLFCTTFQM